MTAHEPRHGLDARRLADVAPRASKAPTGAQEPDANRWAGLPGRKRCNVPIMDARRAELRGPLATARVPSDLADALGRLETVVFDLGPTGDAELDRLLEALRGQLVALALGRGDA